MANFEKELGIDEPTTTTSRMPSMVIVKSQCPFFVLPLCLVCVLLCIHAGIKDFQQRVMKRDIVAVNQRADLALERTHLVGLMHNENFARMSRATGVKPIYIGEDWKINEMPRHLQLTPEAYQYLWFKYYGEPPVTPASFYHRPVSYQQQHVMNCQYTCERACVHRCFAGRCLHAIGNTFRWLTGRC